MKFDFRIHPRNSWNSLLKPETTLELHNKRNLVGLQSLIAIQLKTALKILNKMLQYNN